MRTRSAFFEEVARYPEGEVRYTLPGGTAGVAATTGKAKWYEWVGYAGLAVAAAGLALLTAGASIPATVCFAAGAAAGGVSAGGHLVDTARLGTATSVTVVLDVAQIVASFASFGAMSITVKVGGATAALAGSRWFVPLVSTAAGADVVQLVALTDVTFTELSKIQRGAGTPEDKQRAMAVLLTQLLVTSGLTALSVQGARNARALAGQPLEVVEQNGVKVLRVVGEDTAAPVGHSKAGPGDTHNSSGDIGAKPTDLSGHGSAPIDSHGLKSGTYAESSAASARSHDPEHWLADLEHRLDPDEKAKLTKMARGKTPQQVRDMLGADLHAAHERLRLEVRLEQERAAVAVQSKERVADLRKQIADRGLMNDPDIRVIVEGITAQNRGERLPMLRTSSSPSSCELRPKERILRLRCSMVSKSTRSYARRLLKNGGPRTQVRSLAGSWTAPTGSTSNAVKSIWVRLFWDGANRERFRSVTPPILGSSSEHVAGEARQWPAPSFLDEEYYAG